MEEAMISCLFQPITDIYQNQKQEYKRTEFVKI